MLQPKVGIGQNRMSIALLSFALILVLSSLSSCNDTPTAHTSAISTSANTSNEADPASVAESYSDIQTLHSISLQRNGPNGWTWQTDLPNHRLVIFYGNPLSPVMGPLSSS